MREGGLTQWGGPVPSTNRRQGWELQVRLSELFTSTRDSPMADPVSRPPVEKCHVHDRREQHEAE